MSSDVVRRADVRRAGPTIRSCRGTSARHKLDGAPRHGDAVLGRQLLLANGDVRISYVVADEPSPLYRNAIGDECVYVECGSGVVRDGVRRAAGVDRATTS